MDKYWLSRLYVTTLCSFLELVKSQRHSVPAYQLKSIWSLEILLLAVSY